MAVTACPRVRSEAAWNFWFDLVSLVLGICEGLGSDRFVCRFRHQATCNLLDTLGMESKDRDHHAGLLGFTWIY